MNEFEVLVTPKAGSIDTNFADIKAQLELEMSAYKGVEVSESNLSERKKDVAFLRKVRKAVDDKRKDVKKFYMQPYMDFENSCKELLSVIDEPIDEINTQVKAFDEKRIAEKRAELEKFYTDNIEEFSRFIPFESTLEDTWSNVSYKSKDYQFHLSELKTRVRSDIDVIKSLGSEIEEELINVYQKSGNILASAVQRNQQYLSDKQKISAQVKEQIKEEVTTYIPNETEKRMIKFIVSGEDAEQVRQFLDFSNISYSEE